MSNEIKKYELTEISNLGKIFKASGLFSDIQSEAQAIVKIIAGQELGISPMMAMQGINIIKGKVCLSANLMAHIVKRSGKYNYRVIEHTDKVCKIAFFENGEEVGTSTFSIEDAKLAGLLTKDTWKAYPRNLLFARALSNGVRWYCPDLGLQYTEEELEDIEKQEKAKISVEEIPITSEPQAEPTQDEVEKRARLTKIIHASVSSILKDKLGITDAKKRTELYKISLKNLFDKSSCKDMSIDELQKAANWYSDIAKAETTAMEIAKLMQLEEVGEYEK